MQPRPEFLSVLVGVNELARLLADGKAAVITNWRSRSATFPASRSGHSQPRFDLLEVLQWMQDDGPKGREQPDISTFWWWRKMVEAYADQSGDLEARRTLVALVLLRHLLHTRVSKGVSMWNRLAAADKDGANWRDASKVAERECPDASDLLVPCLGQLVAADALRDLVGFLDAVADLPAERQLRPILDLDRRSVSAKVDPLRTDTYLARLIAALAMPDRGTSVLDPAAGEGQLLIECGSMAPGLTLFGQDVDRGACEIARSRALLNGLVVDLAEPGHDTLTDDQFPHLRTNTVVLDPPLDDRSGGLQPWLLHGYGHLAEGGRMVMVVPAHHLVPVLSARRRPDPDLVAGIMALSELGAIETVVVLPRRLRRDIVGPLLVAVLRRGVEVARPTVISYVREETSNTRTPPRTDAFISAVCRMLRAGGLDGLEDRPYVHIERAVPLKAFEVMERLVDQLESGSDVSFESSSVDVTRKHLARLRELGPDVGATTDPNALNVGELEVLKERRERARHAAAELEKLVRQHVEELLNTDHVRARQLEDALARVLREL